VKGVKQLGVRAGNWLTQDQAHLLLEKATGEDLRSLRDLAMLSVLVGCGLRRAELSLLKSKICKLGRGTGPLWIWLGRAVIFGPSRCRFGWRMPSTDGEKRQG